MKMIPNPKGMSKLILVLLLLLSFIIGALLSYIYTMGFYSPLEFKLPETSVINIENVAFSAEDASFFNVTVLNPSYSPTDVTLAKIEARTLEDNKIHVVTDSMPEIPFILKRRESQTFKCKWNWANYTDIVLPYTDMLVEIRVFLEDGTGFIFQIKRPQTILAVSEIVFNSSISVTHFNVTVQNLESSVTYVNVTEMRVGGDLVQSDKVEPRLPYALDPGSSVAFQCFLNWTALQGENVTIDIGTLQGYIAQRTHTLPSPVTLDITEIVFNSTISSQQFNITMLNAPTSPTYVDINKVTVSIDQQTPTEVEWSAYPTSILEKNSSIILVCTLNWDDFQGQSLTVSVTTSQGFIVIKEAQIP